MGFAGASNAATVDDLEVLKHSYVLVCDDLGARPGKGVLFGANHFLDVTGGTTATNKGQVDLSVVDGNEGYVTQEIVDKYGEDYGGPHYNWLRLKNAQDVIAMKLTAGTKLIIFEQGNNKSGTEARIPKIAKSADLSDALNPAPDADHPSTVAGFRWEFTVNDDGLYYLGSYNGDMFVSFIIVEANEALGTPQVKVGDQVYQDGLWYREVSVKAVEADGLPTIVTYTTDGSTPTASSPLYKEPIKCYQDMTLKFQAYMDLGDGTASEDAIMPNADNEANVSFSFDAPAIEAEGANVTIVSPYENARNFLSLDGTESGAEELSQVTLDESATIYAYSLIENGDYGTFKSKSTTKDVYVLNPIKEKKTIAVTAGTAVIDEEATASSTTGEVYKVEGGEISADKKDFFVKSLTFKALAGNDAQYQVPAGQEAYIQMSNTNISFLVAEGDSVNVKVICSKNSCKNLAADDAEDGSAVSDRMCYVNVSGTNYGGEDLKLNPDGNVIEFGLKGAEGGSIFTFQKYSGTGNIMISSIEITPAAGEAAVQETVLWEGTALVNGWADQPMMLSDGGKELTDAGAAVGDRLRIYFTAPDDNWQVELTNGHWDGMLDRYAAKDLGPEADGSPRHYTIVDQSKGYFEYTIDQDFLTKATTAQYWGGSFLLNGDGNMTVTKVSLVKGGDDTAVKTIKTVKAQNGAIYNLAGQKVSADYKGVVIINGKKVLNK